jgi:hypothetical protein
VRQGVRQREARQGDVEQTFLAGAQLVAARPAVKAIRRWFHDVFGRPDRVAKARIFNV